MARVRRVDFSADEWIGGTLGMTLEEEGLFIRLTARYYSRNEAPPADEKELARICGIRPQVLRRVLARLKLLGKFHETGAKLLSNRCETELKLAQNRIETATINGAKGGRPKNLAKPDGYFPANLTTTTTTKKKESKEDSPPLPTVAAPLAGGPDTPPQHQANGHDRSQGHRLPDDWEPSADDCEFAVQCGLDPNEAADEFRDYWLAKPGIAARKLDWSRTFRNSCRKRAEHRGRGQPDGLIAAARRAFAR